MIRYKVISTYQDVTGTHKEGQVLESPYELPAYVACGLLAEITPNEPEAPSTPTAPSEPEPPFEPDSSTPPSEPAEEKTKTKKR